MAPRGRKPKPTALKALHGNAGKRPLSKTEPQPPASLPSAPSHLNSTARREWDRVAKDLRACGLLVGVDRAALAAYCVAYSRWVTAENQLKKGDQPLVISTAQGNIIQNPILAVSNKAMELMHKFATEFGMTPSSRSRLSAAETEEKGGLAAFLQKGA